MAQLALAFDILARDRASKEFDKVGDAAERAGKKGTGFGSAVKSGLGLAAGAIAAAGFGSMFTGFVNDARESAAVSRLTENAIRATGGAAGVTADQVGKLAESISNKTGVDDEAVQSAANLLLCLEESAQALTRDRGWVTHDQLGIGDEILCYDPDDDTTRWEPIRDFYRYDVDTELIHWKSKQIDVRTTPHHRWWTVGQNDRARYTPQFQTTEQISGKQVRVKIGGGFAESFADEPTWSDDLVELAGWVITEGTVGWTRPSTSQSTQVRLTQSATANPEKTKRIRELMHRLRLHGHRVGEGSAVMPYNRSDMVTWWFAHDLGATLRDMLSDKGLSMAFITRLTREQALLLLDVLIQGDGHTDRRGHRQYVQKDKSQLDLLAGMCAMLGIRTTDLPSRASNGAGSLYLNTTNHAYGDRLNVERGRYRGVVWCPQVRTGIFMARNRGRTFWTGNTFKNVRNEAGAGANIFDRATAAAQDLAAAGFGDADSAAKMLGKALNDPLKGISALSRAGVTFTAEQKEQIKTLVESGDVVRAQGIIMAEVESQVGGAAAAAADPMQRLGVIVGNLGERVGTALLPSIEQAATWLGANLPGALDSASRAFAVIRPHLVNIGTFIRDTVIPALAGMASFVKRNADFLVPFGAAVGTMIGLFKAYQIVQAAVVVVTGAWNAVLLANPIGLVVLAIAGLVAALVVAYNRSETFRNIVQGAWKGIQTAVSWAWNNVLKPALTAWVWYMQHVIGPVVLWLWRNVIQPAWTGISATVQFAWRVIQGAFQAWMWYIRNVLAPAVSWLWRNVVQPAFNGIASVVRWAVDNVVRPAMAGMRVAVDTAQTAFRVARDWVQIFVDKLRSITIPGWVKDLADRIASIAGNLKSGAGKIANFFGFSGDAPAAFRGTVIGGGKALARVQSVLPRGLAVTSTYRSPEHNRRIGGSPTSLHMDRNNPAVDIAGPTAALDRFAATLAAMGGWRQLLWRVAGHFDHIHVAHAGGTVSQSWARMPGDRWDERTVRLQVGERVTPRMGDPVTPSVTVYVQSPVDGAWVQAQARVVIGEQNRRALAGAR